MRSFPSPTKGLAFFSVFYAQSFQEQIDLDQISLDILGADFKSVDISSDTVQSYYTKEFLTAHGLAEDIPLKRLLVYSDLLFARDELVQIKHKAEKWQRKLSIGENRVLNIDPGHVYLEQVLLTTIKPYSHRIYLKEGVYAELVYQFSKGSYLPQSWTYPDYANDDMRSLFLNIRSLLKSKL